MRKQQENKFRMYNAINTYLDENRETLIGHSGLNEKSIELVSKCEEIHQYEEQKRTSTTGRAAAKMRAKNKAINGCIGISAAIFALAKKSDDAELEEISNIQKSYVEKLRETDLIEVLDSVYDMAQVRLDVLRRYGVTPESLESYRKLAEGFCKAFGRCQSGRFDRKFATSNLKKLFKDADGILEQMDKFVVGLTDVNEHFVLNYKDRRMIRHYGIRYEKEPVPETVDEPTTSPPAAATTGSS